MQTNSQCWCPGKFLYYRLIFQFDFFQGRCATCLLQMYACCLGDSTVGIEWIGEGFLPDVFCELPLSHPCKHTTCSGLPGCTSTLWLNTKYECLVSQKIVSILWFIRSLWSLDFLYFVQSQIILVCLILITPLINVLHRKLYSCFKTHS